MAETAQKKSGIKIPHTYVVLFMIIILSAIGTYILPPGEYTRAKDERTGRTLVDATSYHAVDRSPTTVFELFSAIPRGMKKAAEISFFIFICGGAIMAIQKTGAIDAGLSKVIKAMAGRERLMIPIIMLVFSVFGFTIGMAEEAVVFVPLGLALARAVGFDSIVAVAMVSTGAAIGFSAGILNPFTVGVAQGIAELPLFSGAEFRVIGYVLLYITAVGYTMRYASKIKNDPTASLMYGIDTTGASGSDKSLHNVEFTGRHACVLLVMVAGLGYMLYGVMTLDYYIEELATVFLAMGIIGALVGGQGPSEMCRNFVGGFQDIAFGALVVGVARGILVTLESGHIIDTIIFYLSSAIASLPKGIAAIGMFLVQSVINFFIPSGSGQAATTMPIMTALADMTGLTRQTAVMAFHYGDGFSNSIIPTSGSLMAILAMAKVPYEKWVKYIWPLMVIWTIIGAAMCFIAAEIDLGPF